MNKKEFLEVTNGWVKETKRYIRDIVDDILTENDITVKDFCEATNIPVDDLECILMYDGDISLENLSKILVAADLVAEFKPIEDSELGSYEIKKEKKEECENKCTKKQPRDSRGRFVSYDSVVKNTTDDYDEEDEDDTPDFSEMSRPELVEFIEDNLLDDEIDLKNTPTRDLVKFLEEKKEEGYFEDEVIDEDSELSKAIHDTLRDHPERILRLIGEIFM